MKKSPKERTRLWVTGNSEFKAEWNQWAKDQGVIAEDMLRKIVEKTMAHGKVSLDVECGYENSQQGTETQ